MDSIVTDPPYHLSNTKPIEDRIKELSGSFNNVIFPYFNKGDIKPSKYGDLLDILIASSDLRGFQSPSSGVKSWVGVPECAINFNGNVVIRKKEINASNKPSGKVISNGVLVDEFDFKKAEFIGDFVFDFGDSVDSAACDVKGCDFGKFFDGSFFVPVGSIGNTCIPGLDSADSSVFQSDDFVKNIRLANDSFSETKPAAFVLTRWGAKNGFVLAFDMRGVAAELFPADRAFAKNFSGFFVRPQLVRTFAGTGCLSTIFKPIAVCFVLDTADGAHSFYFHLWVPLKFNIPKLYIKVKGFMGKEWDEMPSVDVWKECVRALKPGAFAFIMSTPRQDVLSRMICNLQDAGFEMGFISIYWTYAAGFPKASNIGKMVDKKPYRKERLQLKQYLKNAIKKSGKTKKQIDLECGFTACSYIRVSFRDDDGWGEALPNIQKWFKMKKVIGFDNTWDWLIKENERQLMGRHKSGIGKAFTKNGWGTGSDEVKNTSGKSVLEGSYGGFQPKPAVEIILVCMKLLSEKTYVDQALKRAKEEEQILKEIEQEHSIEFEK